MPPLSPSSVTPRLVVYYQTQHFPDGTPRSILPLAMKPDISVTHVNIAAIHLNDPPGNITLNDHEPSNSRYHTLWAEVRVLQASGIKVLGMLGGAAKGSFTRLDLDEVTFELYYLPLKKLIREKNFDGLDIDVEEEMSLHGVIRLIDRLKADFGNEFLITLAPVATALISDELKYNLSGFSYEALEVMRRDQIAWYNTQFYCGWGDMSNTKGFDQIIARGYPANKIVIGVVTNPENGKGWIAMDVLQEVLINLKIRYPNMGGVMGWEYFNSLPGDQRSPWEWASRMTACIRYNPPKANLGQVPSSIRASDRLIAIDDDLKEATDASVPADFVYFSDHDDM
ncbi:hypothetical protein Golomagni_01061 [Golovinomyces magnicellulatus]|nr:hypothetical protein Golomagni_01061 [Golovinomyces magnicellulatus]